MTSGFQYPQIMGPGTQTKAPHEAGQVEKDRVNVLRNAVPQILFPCPDDNFCDRPSLKYRPA